MAKRWSSQTSEECPRLCLTKSDDLSIRTTWNRSHRECGSFLPTGICAGAGANARTYVEHHFDPAAIVSAQQNRLPEVYTVTDGAQIGETSNQSFYNVDSQSYDERWESKGGAFTNAVQQQILNELCSDWQNGRVLEVGSGTARFSIPLLQAEPHDISGHLSRHAHGSQTKD